MVQEGMYLRLYYKSGLECSGVNQVAQTESAVSYNTVTVALVLRTSHLLVFKTFQIIQ